MGSFLHISTIWVGSHHCNTKTLVEILPLNLRLCCHEIQGISSQFVHSKLTPNPAQQLWPLSGLVCLITVNLQRWDIPIMFKVSQYRHEPVTNKNIELWLRPSISSNTVNICVIWKSSILQLTENSVSNDKCGIATGNQLYTPEEMAY